MVHTIRLRGPWLLRHSSLDAPHRFQAPGRVPLEVILRSDLAMADLLKADLADCVELVRTFNRPTGLNETSTVLLCGRIESSQLSVIVNQSLLVDCQERHDGAGEVDDANDFQVDVTSVLQNSNEIVVSCLRGESEIVIVEVWLEIE